MRNLNFIEILILLVFSLKLTKLIIGYVSNWIDRVIDNFINDRAENLKAICKPRNLYRIFKVILLWYLYTNSIVDPWPIVLDIYKALFGSLDMINNVDLKVTFYFDMFGSRNQIYFELWYIFATYCVFIISHHNIRQLRSIVRSKRKKNRSRRLYMERLYIVLLILINIFYIYCSLVSSGLLYPYL